MSRASDVLPTPILPSMAMRVQPRARMRSRMSVYSASMSARSPARDALHDAARREAGHQFRHRHVRLRTHEIRRNLGERYQHVGTGMEAGMRKDECIGGAGFFPVCDEIEI